MTIADNVGNTVAATITFPVVAKGEQALTGFAYGASQITYNDSVPALTVPSGAVTALEYTAAPATVCSVDGSSGTLTINAVGICTITVSAPANANYNQASATFELTVIEIGTLPLGLDEIAGDNQINSAEKAAGFTISGDTGSVSGAAVTVTVGTQDLTTTSSAAAWTVSVPPDAAYISESSVNVTVNATRTGYGAANLVTRTLVVDLTAPQARSYSAPAALKVGEAITPLGPSTTSDSDIAGYNAAGLPSGLAIDIATGSISGVPDTASASTRQATVTIADNVGNTVAATITFPVVAKGEQALTGFAYGASQITYNDSVPALTVPSGAVTALEYTAAPATVCSVDGSSGTLTINAVGICTITVSAPANANYNQASATFELTVIEIGTLPLGLDEIAGDNQINSAEKAAGFTISGDTGSVSGAAVTVTVGTQDLTTTSSAAAWTVSVPPDAAYISESSVNVTVNATRTGYGAANLVTRTLVVDLTAPQARSYSAPAALKVGEAITPLGPSTTSDSDIAGYNASGLPSGLAIDIATGSISGVPDTASASTRQATVTIADNVGNTVAATITFPVVAKGEQALTGFAYGASQITYNDSVPALTVPSGAVTALEYTAAPATVCSVDGSSGTLTINAVGICTITVSAPANANYNQASATFELTVIEIGTLPLGLDEIAGDNQINSAEKAAGFTISGDTGSVSGAAVTVTVGTQDLTTTSSAAAWTVSVPPDAAYISESSVNVTVNATRTGYGAANLVTRTLVVDLTAPQARSYSAPAALKVGEAITPLGPSTTSDSDIAGYNAAGLPSGLAIDIATGSISGVPDTASASTRQATVTIADNVGNTVAATITFPVVAKGEQALTGFAYGASQITYNDSVPALTVPSGAVTALEYTAAPATVCSVDGSSGTLTINAVGICTITVSAPANANYNQASATFELTVIEIGTLPLGLDEIAGDNQINSAEKAAGFTISGDTGSVSGAAVTVTVGTQDLTTTSSAAAWTVSVPPDAAYISESSVNVTVNATRTGYGAANLVTRTLVVDLTAPQARSYSAPAALKVGEAITPLGPSTTSDSDIAGYNAAGLPSGLAIDIATGSISGVPDTASASTRQATVTIADNVGNTVAATITFPVVAKGEQTLTGFAYGASQITYNDSVPALTVPSGAVTALEYTAAPATVCSVDGSSGTLTINAVGICTITVSAPANANYNQASATFELTVIEIGTLPLGLDEIAGDNQINSAEKAAGFTISGDTGSVSGAAVTVTVGTQDLTTTSSAAAWTVSVPPDAAYISESSVNVTVNATRTGYGAANLVTRTLVVDLTAPQARSYSAPAALKVGEAITPLGPSTTSDSDIAGYNASGLPSGLAIDIATGSISGVPDTASASTRQATVTIADNVGNTVAATITFPVVAKGEQALTGFAYGASQITYNDSVPALTVPSGAVTALEYTAAPATVCSVDGSSGTLTINAVGICTITVSAPANANYNQASATFELTVIEIGTLPLGLDEIAGDNQINSAEKAAGFTISGDTGSVSGAAVTVTVGTQDLTTTSSAAAWTVSVPPDAAYISESSVNVTVNATRTGYGAANLVTRTLVVDLTAPQARSYSAPAALKVGEAITPLGPSTTSDSDIAGYNAAGLPSGLAIDIATGSISGVPDTASASTRQATVTIADNVGNTVAATITFPVVAKGEQALTGFAYGASQITYNDSVPALTVPSGAVTALEYTAAPATVCSVDGSSGTLTINAVGICTITVSAPANANYNQASATFELTVIEIGTLPLGLDEIAGDNQINSAEKAAGFTISGDTGSVSGAAVTVTVGTQDLTTTSSAAAWTVSVPPDAAYISESSVNVTVNATRTGYGAANLVTRTLVVDLTAPQARSYSAPAALKVGEAITPLGPSTTSDSDIAGYNASRTALGSGDRHRHRVDQRRPGYGQRQHPAGDGDHCR